MKLAFAAPESGFPSLLNAASSQHFLMELVRAAPERGLPSLLTAFAAQELWAIAEPDPNNRETKTTASKRAISTFLMGSARQPMNLTPG
jgi:hypothetical protein